MISFLNDKYKKLGEATFHIQGSILCFFSDISALLYLMWFGLDKYLSKDFLALNYAMHGIDINTMPVEQVETHKTILINSMGTAFTAFIAFHAIVYYMFFKDKKWAKKYVFGYTLTTFILSFFEGGFMLTSSPAWGLCLILMALAYFYVHMGIRYFRKPVKTQAR